MAFPTTVDTIVDAPPFSANTLGHASQVLGPQRITVGPLLLNARSDQFASGADPTGATDSGPAITAALNAAVPGPYPLLGNEVWLPQGTYITNSQIVVPFRTTLKGLARDGTTIKAGPSFPTNTAVIRLGDTLGGIGMGCRVENLTIDCNNVAGSTGIYSERINEQSGVFRCLVQNYGSFGVRINQPASGQSAQNYSIDNVEITSGSGTGAGAIGLAITNTSINTEIHSIFRVSIVATGQTQLTKAMQVDGVLAGLFADIHVENAVTGILVGSVVNCSGSTFKNITGLATVTNLLTWSSATSQNALTAIGLNNPTNQLVDQINGITINATEQVVGFYALGTGATRAILNNVVGQPTRIGNDLGSVGATPTLGALQTGVNAQSIVGTDLHGKVTITTTGTPPTAGNAVAIVNFARTKAAAPAALAGTQGGTSDPFFIQNTTTGAMTIATNATLGASATFTIGYIVMGT